MFMEEQKRYHEARACQELDRAYYSDHPKAAAAHFRMSALHMERARALLMSLVEEASPPLIAAV